MAFTPASQILGAQNQTNTGFTPASDILIKKYQEEEQKKPNYLQRVAQGYKEAGQNVQKDIEDQAVQYRTAQDNGDVIGQAKALGRSALRTVGNVASAAFTPITEAVKPVIEPVVSKLAQNESFQHVVNPIIELANKHPEAAKDIQNLVDILTLGAGKEVEKPVTDTIKGAAKDATGSVQKAITDISDGLAARSDKKAFDKSIQDVMPFQKKNVRISELRSAMPDSGKGTGGVTRKGLLGESAPQATEKDIEVAKTAHPFISTTKDPLKKIQNVNQGISDFSSDLDSFLDKNPTRANFEDMRTYLERNKPSSSLQKDPGAMDSYNRATESALKTLADTLKKSTSPEVSGSEIRSARIKIDQQIARELGETTFDSPQYKGIKAAEVDTRNMINRMNEDLLRYPGQLDKVNRMNEFIDSARNRGIEVDISNPEVRETLEKQFGLTKTAESDAAAEKLSSSHREMSNLYQARDNMIDKYQSKVGGNKVKEWIRDNPKLAKILGFAIGGTIIDKTLKSTTGVGF